MMDSHILTCGSPVSTVRFSLKDCSLLGLILVLVFAGACSKMKSVDRKIASVLKQRTPEGTTQQLSILAEDAVRVTAPKNAPKRFPPIPMPLRAPMEWHELEKGADVYLVTIYDQSKLEVIYVLTKYDAKTAGWIVLASGGKLTG